MTGVGVTTYNRPNHLELWKDQYNKHWFPCDLSIEDDTKDRRGIAYRKNRNLIALRKCEYIFLFDDDCFPIRDGWTEFFIEASKASGQEHFMYLKETPTIKKLKTFPISSIIDGKECFDIKHKIDIYDNCAGCMMFLTKKVLNTVGAFNPDYGVYGFEHAGYSNRVHMAGLTPLGSYSCPSGASEYIYSLDLDNHLPFNKQVKHAPSLAKEINFIPKYIEQNKEVYLRDTIIHIPLEDSIK